MLHLVCSWGSKAATVPSSHCPHWLPVAASVGGQRLLGQLHRKQPLETACDHTAFSCTEVNCHTIHSAVDFKSFLFHEVNSTSFRASRHGCLAAAESPAQRLARRCHVAVPGRATGTGARSSRVPLIRPSSHKFTDTVLKSSPWAFSFRCILILPSCGALLAIT